jgi:hypothetical protein
MIDDQQDITQLRQTLQQAQEKVQILRAELYRLRRQPLPPSQPEASIQAGQDDERTRIQEALDLSHRTAQIYEAELHRMRTRSSRENSAPVTTDQQRGCLLTGWLTFSIISSICYFVLLILGGLSFFGFILSPIILMLSLIGITGLWNLERWGYYWMICLYMGVVLMSFILLGAYVAVLISGFGIVMGLFNLIVLTLLVLPRWKYFA